MKQKTFIVAELSANHNGKKETALETIRAAKRAGADAIKLQTYTAETITLDCKSDLFKIAQGTAWDGKYLYDLYQEAYTPWEWQRELFDLAHEQGLLCFSSPFDNTAVDFLEKLNNPLYKIASFEITDIPLIEYAASKGKPMILSTGIAALEDIELALQACRRQGNNDITLLKCTSQYPALPQDAHLQTIPDIQKRFDVKVGLSDHTMGIEAPLVAVALGACMIEKHFILDRNVGGPDAHFSLDEKEFSQMVQAVRKTEQMLGQVDYELTEKKKNARTFSRSLFVAQDVKAGETISEKNMRSIRPGHGLHPKHYHELLGKKFTCDAFKGTPLSWELVKE